MRKLLTLSLPIALLAAATPARAAGARPSGTAAPASMSSSSPMDNSVSVFGLLGYSNYGWAGGEPLGIGVRFQKTIVPQGFIRSGGGVRDDLGIEGGFDYLRASWDYRTYVCTAYDAFGFCANYGWVNASVAYNELTPTVGVVWNVWLNQQFAIYPKLDLQYRYVWFSWSDPNYQYSNWSWGGLNVQGSAGLIYRLNAVQLRAEFGWQSLHLGVGFKF